MDGRLRRLTTTMLGMAVALTTALALTPPSTAGQLDYVVTNFDDLPAGTVLGSQYHQAGITSWTAPPALKAAIGGFCPTTTTIAGGSDITPPNHVPAAYMSGSSEFVTSGVCFTFSKPQSATASIQFNAIPPRMFAMYADGTVKQHYVGPTSVDRLLKRVNLDPGAIAFAAATGMSGGGTFAIDNINADPLPGLAGKWAAVAAPSKGVRAGSTAEATVQVSHYYGNNSATNWTLDPTGVPPRVTATLLDSSLPSSTSPQTVRVRLTAASNARPGDFNLKLTGVDANNPAKVQQVTIPTKVVGLGFEARTSESLSPCSPGRVYGEINAPASDSPLPARVAISVTPQDATMATAGPADVVDGADIGQYNRWWDVPFSAKGFKLPSTGTMDLRGDVTWTVHEPDGTKWFHTEIVRIPVVANAIQVSEIPGQRAIGTPNASTPRWQREGLRHSVRANGLCPGSTITFGVSQPVPIDNTTPTSGVVRLPVDATPGTATVTDPHGNTASTAVTGITTARSQSLFPFANASVDKGISWKRWKEAYGNELRVKIDVCGTLTLGLGTCAKWFDDPVQYTVFETFMRTQGRAGLCFGHVLLSDWLERGRVARAGLGSPNGSNYDFVTGNNGPLQAELERKHILQLSPSMITRMSPRVTSVQDLKSRLDAVLSADTDAFLAVQKGSGGHIVRATRAWMEGTSLKVEISDPNVPYWAAENTDPALHATRLAASTITVSPAAGGGYSLAWQSTATDRSFARNDSDDALRVIDPREIPTKFASPLTPEGLAGGLVFILGSSTGTVELRTRAGKALEQDSMRWMGGEDDGMTATTGVKTDVYAHNLDAPGGHAQVLLGGHGVMSVLSQQAKSGATPVLGLEKDGTSVLPASAGGTRTNVVVRKLGKTRRTTVLRVAAGLGLTTDVTKKGATFKATSGSGSLTATLLDQIGTKSYAAVNLPALKLRKGDRVQVPTKAFHTTPGKSLTIRITRKGRTTTRTLRNKAPRLVKKLRTRARAGKRGIAVSARAASALSRNPAGQVLVSWTVKRGKKVVARGTRVLGARARIRTRLTTRKLNRGDVVRVSLVGLLPTGHRSALQTTRRLR